jgi:hypothetical protein
VTCLRRNPKQTPQQRHRDSAIAEAIGVVGLTLARLLPLVLAGYLVHRLNRPADMEEALRELLVMEIARERPSLLTPSLDAKERLEHPPFTEGKNGMTRAYQTTMGSRRSSLATNSAKGEELVTQGATSRQSNIRQACFVLQPIGKENANGQHCHCARSCWPHRLGPIVKTAQARSLRAAGRLHVPKRRLLV